MNLKGWEPIKPNRYLHLFTDGSVNPGSGIGYGAYLAVQGKVLNYSEVIITDIQIKQFSSTSSTKLEIQTLIWALYSIRQIPCKIIIYTDSQNIIGLWARRERLEKSNYLSKGNKPITNRALYKEFFRLTDELTCEFKKMKGHRPTRLKDEAGRFFCTG